MQPRSASDPARIVRCDLLIPAFNHPDLLRDLLGSIAATANRDLLGHLWIGDDASDAFSGDAFRRLAAGCGLPATVVRHPENRGFGANCNDLFRRSQSDVCIILNTDVILPPYWLERMLAPLLADPEVALATPLSTKGVNHAVRLRPGQTWMDVDRLLASRAPRFPADCTAIGFCMAVNARALRERSIPLFDPAFGRGYGEDSDLHYRVLAQGLKSLIVDNLLVHHAGGASFSGLPEAPALRVQAESRFRDRWGKAHAADAAAFRESKALDLIADSVTKECVLRAPASHVDLLFVLSTTHLRYGGIWLASVIMRALVNAGFRVAAYVEDRASILADTTLYGFRTHNDPDDLRTSVASLGCVVSVSRQSIHTALALSREYGCAEAHLLQGMEVAFAPYLSVETFRQYGRIENFVAVSEALRDYIRIIHPGARVSTLPVGPDPLVFYPREVAREPRTVAVAMNETPQKGYTYALQLALMLRDRGFRILFFGWDHRRLPMPPEIGTVLEDTSRDALARLFSRAEFIIDASYTEGLGLLPLEAAFCGCVPILATKGGSEYIFKNGRDCIRIPGYRGLAGHLDRIAGLSPRRLARLRANGLRLRARYNLERGLAAAVEAFGELAGCTGRGFPSSLAEYAIRPAADY